MNNTIRFRLQRIKVSLGYMILNTIINQIPAWWIRKLLYKEMGMKIGKYCRIGIGTVVIFPRQIELHNHAIVNEYCFLDGRGGLVIGENSSVGIYSKLITASHELKRNSFTYQHNPIEIGEYVFLGASVIVLENSVLKRGCAIGAGAVVKGICEENAIYVGNPAKKIGEREGNYAYQLYQDYYFR